MTTSAMFDTNELLDLLGCMSDAPELERFLTAHRVHDRPKTVAELEDEEFIEDDGDTDVEYELAQASKESMVVQSERLGFCLMFETRDNYALVHDEVPDSQAPFVVNEIGLFAKGVQIYQQFLGALPGGLSFNAARQDTQYNALGLPIARRDVHETSFDLFILNERIVNFGFDESTVSSLRLVHIREQNSFDRRMLAPYAKASASQTDWKTITGSSAVGRVIADAEVVEFFAALGIDADDMYDGVCPEEITRLTKSHGITLYFQTPSQRSKANKLNIASGQRLSGMTFKRRGDLGSLGYHDALPFAFEFGDAPQTQATKAGRPPDRQHQSDELLSYYWQTDSGAIVQAVSSLIDWQLCRVTLHAPFVATEMGFAA